MKRACWIGYAVVLASMMTGGGARAQEPAAVPKGDKVLAEVLAMLPVGKDGPEAPLLKAGGSIVCLGDSITAGGGYLRDMDAVFAQQYPELKIPTIIKAGFSGKKAEDLILRFQKEVLDRKPALVTINVGINDVWHRLGKMHDDAVLAAYKENVTKMVEQAQAAGIQVVLLSPTIIKEDPKEEGNQRLLFYVAAMKAIAAEKKCGFADLNTLFLEALKSKPADLKANWLTGDGVHMQAKGNAIMAIGALRAMGVPDAKIAATLVALPPPPAPKAVVVPATLAK